jgi:hypothetical protein
LLVANAEVGDTGYFAVVSQTCDIAGAGPGSRHPFVQVCPVRNIGAAFSPEKIQHAQSGEIVEYVYLTKPPETGRHWTIDLRLSVPLSKGVLVAADPIVGFADESDEIDLGARIAAKYARPALHDYLSKDFIQSLNDFVSREVKKGADWCSDVEQLRLVIEGDRLAPKRVQLIAVTEVDFNDFTNRSRKKALNEHWKTYKRALKQRGIEQALLSFKYIDKFNIKDYRNAVPLNIPALRRGRFD